MKTKKHIAEVAVEAANQMWEQHQINPWEVVLWHQFSWNFFENTPKECQKPGWVYLRDPAYHSAIMFHPKTQKIVFVEPDSDRWDKGIWEEFRDVNEESIAKWQVYLKRERQDIQKGYPEHTQCEDCHCSAEIDDENKSTLFLFIDMEERRCLYLCQACCEKREKKHENHT